MTSLTDTAIVIEIPTCQPTEDLKALKTNIIRALATYSCDNTDATDVRYYLGMIAEHITNSI